MATGRRSTGPARGYWRELAAHFPDAKVVLTVRDPDEWFDSAQATIWPFVTARGKHPTPHANAIAEMAYQLVAIPTFDEKMLERDYATRVFKKHIAEVQAEIPADRLLTFELSEGWEPLCAFLGVAVPEIPFPKTNSSRQFHEEEWKEERTAN